MMTLCKQLLISTTSTMTSVQGRMTPFVRDDGGIWRQAWSAFPVVFGIHGMAWDEDTLRRLHPTASDRIKREGDGCSPIGSFPLAQAFGQAPHPDIRFPYLPIAGLEGVDDPSSCYYNQLVRRHDLHKVDWMRSERMDEYPIEYNWGLFVGYNSDPPKPYAGSCIFIHVWSSPEKGTAGCTAMADEMMRKILAWLDPACHPRLIQCPENVYKDLCRLEDLPVL